MKNILFITVFLVFIYNAFADYRYVCRLSNTNDINSIKNFYVSKDKIYMAGKTGNGTYELIEKNKSGYLGVNVSSIGKEFGIETILINKKKGTFNYQASISVDGSKKIVKTDGLCDLYK